MKINTLRRIPIRPLAVLALAAALYAAAFGVGRMAGPVAPGLVPGAPAQQHPDSGTMPGMGMGVRAPFPTTGTGTNAHTGTPDGMAR